MKGYIATIEDDHNHVYVLANKDRNLFVYEDLAELHDDLYLSHCANNPSLPSIAIELSLFANRTKLKVVLIEEATIRNLLSFDESLYTLDTIRGTCYGFRTNFRAVGERRTTPVSLLYNWHWERAKK